MSGTERFRQLSLEELDADQRRALEPILAFAGGITGPFNATLRSAELTARSFSLGEHLLFGTTLHRRLVEMAVLIRARYSGSQLEWWAHEPAAREAGLDEAICSALREGRRPASMAEDEAAVFDLSVGLLSADSVDDATFRRARDLLGERGVVELSYLLGFYGMISLVLKLAEVDPPDGSRPLAPLDAPFT